MSDNLYLRYQGRVSGPFPFEKIQEMLKRGQISRLHQISPDRASWTRVVENEVLVPPSPPEPEPTVEVPVPPVETAAPTGGRERRAPQVMAQEDHDAIDGLAQVVKRGRLSGGKQNGKAKDNSGPQAVVFSCIGAGIMLLGVVGMLMTGRNATGFNITFGLVHLLLLIAAAIVSGALESKARGIALLAIAGFAVFISGIGWLLFFPCMALLQGNLAYRLKSPKRHASRMFGIVVSSVNLLLFVVMGLVLLASWGQVLSEVEGRAAVGATLIVFFVSVPAVCGILGSVFALVDAIQDGHKSMNIAAQVLLSCTLVIPVGILAVAVGAGAANFGSQVGVAGLVLVLTIILIAVFYGCQLALLRLGLIALLHGTEPTEEELAAQREEQEIPATTAARQPTERSRLTAAIYCRGCGREIHATAQTCPHCGAPQKAQD